MQWHHWKRQIGWCQRSAIPSTKSFLPKERFNCEKQFLFAVPVCSIIILNTPWISRWTQMNKWNQRWGHLCWEQPSSPSVIEWEVGELIFSSMVDQGSQPRWRLCMWSPLCTVGDTCGPCGVTGAHTHLCSVLWIMQIMSALTQLHLTRLWWFHRASYNSDKYQRNTN